MSTYDGGVEVSTLIQEKPRAGNSTGEKGPIAAANLAQFLPPGDLRLVWNSRDIRRYIDFYLRRAVEAGDAVTAYVFGACFRAGGFPIGVHDVHMNQGNSGKWMKDNGTWGPAGAFALTERNGHSWYE